MRVFCVLLAAVCVWAEDCEERRSISKLPFVADAVGNAFTPPSKGPVGSPVNLLTPDRYEFYTFDESGELVKRLMTLEEIQAIVAAGEETEGLVTFANDDQPTIAFNFSQPPYTKVHNVVTNVQNVLKAQMEAHKNQPLTKPTLDTPDVSDTWSLILPSIFGNTGVDIVPDRTSATFSTPETETFEVEETAYNGNALQKEGINIITSSTNTIDDESEKEIPVTEKFTTTTVKATSPKICSFCSAQKFRTTTTTTSKPATKAPTLALILSTKTTKPSSTKLNKPFSTTTSKPVSTTANIPRTTTTYKSTSGPLSTTSGTTKTKINTTSKPASTTIKPRTTTTVKPTTKTFVRTTSKTTTAKFIPTTLKPSPFTASTQITTSTIQSTTKQKEEGNFAKIQTSSNTFSTVHTTDKSSIHYEQINTFVPISTAAYVTERTTPKTIPTIKPLAFSSTTKRSITAKPTKQSFSTLKIQPTTYKPISSTGYVSTSQEPDSTLFELNSTTVTTQSVSPSTTMASTEFVSIGTFSHITKNNLSSTTEKVNDIKEPAQDRPFFDISESFSQIASDLGNYQPVPTSEDLTETTKLNNIDLVESKDSLEIDIPEDKQNNSFTDTNLSNENDNYYIKVSTVIPPCTNISEDIESNDLDYLTNSITTTKAPTKFESTTITNSRTSTEAPIKFESTTDIDTTSTIDPILSGSMEDLLILIVNQSPQTIVELEKTANEESKPTTENLVTSITEENKSKWDANFETSTIKMFENLLEPTAEIIKNSTKTVLVENNDSEITKGNKPIDNIAYDNKTEGPTPETNDGSNKTAQVPDDIENQTETVQFISSSLKPDLDEITTEINDTKPITLNYDVQLNEEGNKTSQSIENKDKVVDDIKAADSNSSSFQENKEVVKMPASFVVNTENTLSQPEITHNKLVTINSDNYSNITQNDAQFGMKVEEFKKKIQKVNIDDKELTSERNSSWKLISTIAPPKADENYNEKIKHESQDPADSKDKNILLDHSTENQGLEVTTKHLGEDVAQFTELFNELAFRYWQTMVENIDKKRSFVLSPYSITSMLAMIFMGARGATSGEMNEILKLDDMVTFNPHFTLKNISDSIETGPNSGVAVSTFIRELFSNRDKGRILTFYKERANHFYNGHVEEVNFKLISDIIRRRSNLLVKRYTWGRIPEYMKSNTITMRPPLAAFSANIFQTDCSQSSVDGRDGEMYFVVSPNVRQRRLVPVPAVVYRAGFLAGYDPSLDATAAALGSTNSVVSTLFLMPGQQGNVVHSDDLEALEKRLLDSRPTTATWNRLLRTLLPRIGLELQIPRFLHKSIFNVSSTLQNMGLKDLFDEQRADLGGIIGPSKDLYVSDMVQSTTFVTCGEGVIGEQHHMEEYPETLGGPQRRRTSRWAIGWEEPRDYQRAFHDPHDVGEAMHLPLHLRPRQARLPARNTQPARLKFDRPFLYFVRHNPTGMLLYVGRYNPRLLP